MDKIILISFSSDYDAWASQKTHFSLGMLNHPVCSKKNKDSLSYSLYLSFFHFSFLLDIINHTWHRQEDILVENSGLALFHVYKQVLHLLQSGMTIFNR